MQLVPVQLVLQPLIHRDLVAVASGHAGAGGDRLRHAWRGSRQWSQLLLPLLWTAAAAAAGRLAVIPYIVGWQTGIPQSLQGPRGSPVWRTEQPAGGLTLLGLRGGLLW